jgi:hypothetical protein
VKGGDLSAAEAASLLNTLADVREMRARWRRSFGGQRKVVQKRLERGEATPAELELFLGVK